MPEPEKPKYHILSPDGFPISAEPFASQKEAEDFIPKWCERYQEQGHYTTADRERIPVGELPDHVKVVLESEYREKGTDAEDSMKRLGHHLRAGWEKQPVDSERSLSTIREAVREQWKKEQDQERPQPAAEPEKNKDRQRDQDEPEP